MPFPFIVKIEAYNEAGERVKLIVEDRLDSPFGGIDILQGGSGTSVFNQFATDEYGNVMPLVFRLPGVRTPDQLMNGYADFAWAGFNDNGQEINQGLYYIKISVTDSYGHVNTTTKEIMLIKQKSYVKVSIYNSAGELVRQMEKEGSPGTQASLSIEEIVAIDKNGSSIPIGYGGIDNFYWDGRNGLGKPVESGIYEVQLETMTADGYSVVASRTIAVMYEGSNNVLSDPDNPEAFPKAYPNPKIITGDFEGRVTFEWFAASEGNVYLDIYNMAGELVKKVKGRLNPNSLSWDMRSTGNHEISSGTYIVVMRGVRDNGDFETKKIKLVIIRQFDVYNP